MEARLFHCALVIIGGGLGALLRYGSIQWVNSLHKAPFALGTLVVNAAGSALIGFFAALLEKLEKLEGGRLLVITGFLGGYTTFSAYALETARYFLSGNILYGLLNILAHNALCIACVGAGMGAAGFFLK
ncbi:MAG: CrcB family protein [Spirochaetaceae bacterium]|nr:CrcB family protein [Spirochaetaceae bacterium]